MFAGTQPDFGRMTITGKKTIYKVAETNDYSAKDKNHFKVNTDASVIAVKPFGREALSFSIADRNLSGFQNLTGLASYTDNYSGIIVTDWNYSNKPKINSKSTSFLKTNEKNFSVDISKDAKKIVFGADWNIYCTDVNGNKLWSAPVQAMASAVNISGDDKIVTAALGDGTIRWYSMADGKLLMSLFLHLDNKRRVLWSPDGYFDCSTGAEELIGWHVNQGADREALYYPASQFYEQFYTPGLGAKILAGEDYKGANKLTITDVKLPPLVKITSPTSQSTVTNQTLTVTVKVTDQGGGIDEIRLYLNDKLVETTNRGFVVVEKKGNETTKTFTITLANGENRIKATAFSTHLLMK